MKSDLQKAREEYNNAGYEVTGILHDRLIQELEKQNEELKEDLIRDNETINIINHANILLSNKIEELEKQNEEFKDKYSELLEEAMYFYQYYCNAHRATPEDYFKEYLILLKKY